MIRRQPRSKRRTPSFPTRLASDLGEEGVVADRLAQRLQGHPDPQVDAGGEELLAARLAWWVVDHVLAEAVVAPSRLRRRRSARALEEDPLGVGGEALVEPDVRSEEHTSELQSLMRISYAVFCLKKKNKKTTKTRN